MHWLCVLTASCPELLYKWVLASCHFCTRQNAGVSYSQPNAETVAWWQLSMTTVERIHLRSGEVMLKTSINLSV